MSGLDQAKLPHDDRGPELLGVSWGLTGLATLFLTLRLYCKYSSRRRLWWDDYILIAAWVTIIVNDILSVMLVREYGLGHHSWDLLPGDPVRFTLLLSSRATVTITSIGWTKSAFAVTLLRLTTDRTKILVWFILISLNIVMGVSALVPWIQCWPLAKGWDASIEGTCWAPGVGVNIWIPTGAYSAAMDFTLAILPWTFLWKIRMQKREKLGILIAMSMGIIAGVVAIVKCITLPKLNNGDAFVATELYIWDVTESTVTMIAACIPTLRVLIMEVTDLSKKSEMLDLPTLSLPTALPQETEKVPAVEPRIWEEEMKAKGKFGSVGHV